MSSGKVKQRKPRVFVGKIIKALVVFFSWFTLRLNQVMGAGLGYLFYWLPNSNQRITKINIREVYPHLAIEEQQALVKSSLIETAKATTELGPAWCWPADKLLGLVKEVKGQALIDDAVAQQKGVIFLTPHIGSWELVASYLSNHYPATFLYKPPNVPSVEKFMVSARGRFGGKLAPTNTRGVRTLIKALKNNEVTVILPDQDPGESGGVYAPFLGRPARTMTLVSKLLQKTECACLFVVMERLPEAKGYTLHVLPADDKLASLDAEEATTALNKGIESCIAIAPEQYLWSYKRFRKPPPGVENIYQK